MTGEQSPVAGHPSACRTVVGNICVCVRDIKELFRFILREPLVPGLSRWELRLMSAYSHLLHSVIQELKGCFPLLKRCRASGGHRPLGNDRAHRKRLGGRFYFLTRGRHTHWNAIFKTRAFLELGGRIVCRQTMPVRSCITEQQRVFGFPSKKTVNIPNASSLRNKNVQAESEGTNCTGNEYLTTTAFFTLCH